MYLKSEFLLLRFGAEAKGQSDGKDAVDVEEGLAAALERFGNAGSAVNEQGDAAALDAEGEVVPLTVGQVALKPRRAFAGQILLVGEVEARIVGDFHADLRLALERAQREDETGRTVARRLGREEQGEVGREDGGEDLEGRDVDRVVAVEEQRRRTRSGRLDTTRQTVGAAKMVQQIRGT